MKFALAYAALLTLLFGCLREQEATNHGLPLVQAAAPEAAANRLFSPCPLTPQNVPILKPEITT